MMELSVTSLGIYAVQGTLLVLIASAAAALLAHPYPAVRYRYWQTVVAICVILPLLPAAAPAATVRVSETFSAAALAVAPDSTVTTSVVALIVASGILLRLAWLAWGARRLSALRRSSAPAALDPAVRAAAREIAGDVDIRVDSQVEQPVSFGWRRPVVVIPAMLLRQRTEIQLAAVLHECIHVARRDWPRLLIEHLVRAALWFHPGIWWALDRLQLAREQLVDALVVRRLGGHRSYAQALLLFADRPAPAAASALLFGRHLRHRIGALAAGHRPSRPRLAASAVCLSAILAAATVNIAAIGQSSRGSQIYSPGNGVSLPSVVKEVHPKYTRDAMQAKIQGRVALGCVVNPRGIPEQITVLDSLDREHGLDRAAVEALRQWRFHPGTKDGKPVPVRISIEMTFTLK